MKGRCRTCGASIIWVTMVTSGKRMPVDAKAQSVVLLSEGASPQGEVAQGHTSHFATCPDAAKHRRTTE